MIKEGYFVEAPKELYVVYGVRSIPAFCTSYTEAVTEVENRLHKLIPFKKEDYPYKTRLAKIEHPADHREVWWLEEFLEYDDGTSEWVEYEDNYIDDCFCTIQRLF